MNIWDDEWGEQGEDWSGGGALQKRFVESGNQLGVSLYELDPGTSSSTTRITGPRNS